MSCESTSARSKILNSWILGAIASVENGEDNKNTNHWSKQFDLFLMVIDMLIEFKRRDEVALALSDDNDTADTSTEPQKLVFYDDKGLIVKDPPREYRTNPVSDPAEMFPERYLAWQLRKMYVRECAQVHALAQTNYQNSIYANTLDIILSQGFMFDPIKVAQAKHTFQGWGTPSFIPLGDCLIRAAAIGFQHGDDYIENVEYLTKITHLDVCCIASCVTIATLIHSLVYGCGGNASTNADVVTHAITAGINYLPASRQKLFRHVCSINNAERLQKIKPEVMPMHVYKNLAVCMYVLSLPNGSGSSGDIRTQFGINTINKIKKLTNDPVANQINGILAGMLLGLKGAVIENPQQYIKRQIHIKAKVGEFVRYLNL